MDLALALGRDIGSMSERRFAQWGTYARRKSFPLRRIEFALATIAMKMDRYMGVNNTSLRDYLFDPQRDEHGHMVNPTDSSIINENDLD